MKWLIALLISGVAAAMASSNDLVVATTFASLGLMVPVWLLAANLWWMIGLLLLWKTANAARGPVFASVVVLGGIASIAGGFYTVRAGQVAQLPAAEHLVLAKVATKPQSLDYVLQTADSFQQFETCDALCLAAFRGEDIRWIRLVRFQTLDAAHVVFPVAGKTCADLHLPGLPTKGCLAPTTQSRYSAIIERRDRSACLAQQPNFPAAEVCLSFVPEDGRKADLALTITEADFSTLQAASGNLVRLNGVKTLTLQDLRGATPVDLALHTARSYTQVSAPLPLAPAMSLQSSAGGFVLPHSSQREALPDFAMLLAEAGVAVQPASELVRGAVDPFVIIPPEPVQQALALTRGAEPLSVWLRVDPPKPPPAPPPKRRSAAEIAASKQARRAKEDKMIMDAMRHAIPAAAP